MPDWLKWTSLTANAVVVAAALAFLLFGGPARKPKTESPAATRAAQPKETGRAEPAPVDTKGWGILKPLPAAVGPGSRFQRFLSRLQEEAKGWHLFSIEQPTTGGLRVQFFYGVQGVDAYLNANSSENIYVTVLFMAPGMWAATDLKKAVVARNERIMQAARAMELSGEEMRRLRRVLNLLPYARPDYVEQAMWRFMEQLPGRIQVAYKSAWAYRDSLAALRAKIIVDGVGPAVGFPLSNERVLDIGFCPLESLPGNRKNVKIYKFGPCWSAAIWPSSDDGNTQAGGAKTEGQFTTLPWPRLTLAEVDALAGD